MYCDVQRAELFETSQKSCRNQSLKCPISYNNCSSSTFIIYCRDMECTKPTEIKMWSTLQVMEMLQWR